MVLTIFYTMWTFNALYTCYEHSLVLFNFLECFSNMKVLFFNKLNVFIHNYQVIISLYFATLFYIKQNVSGARFKYCDSLITDIASEGHLSFSSDSCISSRLLAEKLLLVSYSGRPVRWYNPQRCWNQALNHYRQTNQNIKWH